MKTCNRGVNIGIPCICWPNQTRSREMSRMSNIFNFGNFEILTPTSGNLNATFWCVSHWHWTSGCRVMSSFINARSKQYKTKRIWTFSLQISQKQHPMHSPWSRRKLSAGIFCKSWRWGLCKGATSRILGFISGWFELKNKRQCSSKYDHDLPSR